jgi:hypothetical protein
VEIAQLIAILDTFATQTGSIEARSCPTVAVTAVSEPTVAGRLVRVANDRRTFATIGDWTGESARVDSLIRCGISP